jgi:hypothetical protein
LSSDISQQVNDYKQVQRDIEERGLIALQYADTGAIQKMWETGDFNDQPQEMKDAIEKMLRDTGRI